MPARCRVIPFPHAAPPSSSRSSPRSCSSGWPTSPWSDRTSPGTRVSPWRCTAPASGSGRRCRAGPGSKSPRCTTGSPGWPTRSLGETAGAARLPSVLAGVAIVGLTLLVGTRLYGPAAGLHGGFALGTSLLFFVYGRAASMDMLLAAAVTGAVGLAGLRLLGLAGPRAMAAAWACAGLATLAKGPLGTAAAGARRRGLHRGDAAMAAAARVRLTARPARLRADRGPLVLPRLA